MSKSRTFLTPRLRQVVCLLGSGNAVREAAYELGVSPKTVEYHLSVFYRKSGCRSLVDLTHWAFARHLVKNKFLALLVCGFIAGCGTSPQRATAPMPSIPAKAGMAAKSLPAVFPPKLLRLMWYGTGDWFEVQCSTNWPPAWRWFAGVTNANQVPVLATNGMAFFRVRTWVGSQHSVWTDGSDTL